MIDNVWLLALLVAVLAFFVDIVYAKYTVAASKHKAFTAAFWSALIFLIGGFNISVYVENHWLLIPTAIGGFIGTYVGIKTEKKD